MTNEPPYDCWSTCSACPTPADCYHPGSQWVPADDPPFVWAAIDNTNRIQGLYWAEEQARRAHPECVDFEKMTVT